MLRTLPLLLFPVLFSSQALAATWPQSEVDKAVAIVKASAPEECVQSAGTEIAYDVEQIDLNKDGLDELVVTARAKELGQGATACFGRSGQEVHLLIPKGKDGGWDYQFGFEMQEFVYHQSNTEWPDIEFSGAGFCFPIWRYHEGAYGMWKVCDDDRLIYADVAPWIKEGAVPRDAGKSLAEQASTQNPSEQKLSARTRKAGEAYMHETDLSGPEFWHNDSLMVVDPKRGMIIYKEPKPSIRGVVKPGDVLFYSEMPWDMYDSSATISGTAWVFKKGCDPVGYRVQGGLRKTWHTLVLRGEAPVRKKGSCEIAGLSKTSGNAELVFESDLD